MQVRWLRFAGMPPGEEPVAAEGEISPDFFSQGGGELPAAYVVMVSDLDNVRKFGGLIMDRGRKHKAKGLSKLLLGQKKTVLIDGNFSAPGQLRRSVRTLLANAAGEGEKNRYIIGARPDIFETLWKQTQQAASGQGPTIDRERIEPAPSGISDYDGGEITPGEFLGMLDNCVVPPQLMEKFKGRSVQAQLVRKLIVLASKSDHKVLILGDTGTGKEVVARAIHELSPRSSEKFMAVNCSGIPRELLESELFGHEKGSFTGALSRKTGLWEGAHKGTLFLDEIGDMPLEHQAKVLRALEDGEIRRVGANESKTVDTRIIAATNRDLYAMVLSGQFREDLYYRLREFLIQIKPLRERIEDIPMLAQHCWGKIVANGNEPLPAEISEELKRYGWMGNVRELKTVLTNFHDVFREQKPSVNGLRAIFQFYGQALVSKGPQKTSQGLPAKDIERLQNLRQADELIGACEVNLRPMLQGAMEARVLASLKVSLKLRMQEMDMLFRDPLVFQSMSLFDEINMFKGKLAYLQGLLQKDAAEGAGFWEKEGVEVAARVRSAIAVEVRGLLSDGR